MPYSDPEEAKQKKRAWYLANKERIAAKYAQKYKEEGDEIRARSNAHYHANREEIIKRRAEINKENPDQKKRWNARYKEKNSERLNAWAKDNRDIVNAWKRRYYRKHSEKVKAYNRSKNEGWENAPQRMELWEINDDAMLFTSELSDKELAAELGRSVMAISTRRSILKKEYGDDEIPANAQTPAGSSSPGQS